MLKKQLVKIVVLIIFFSLVGTTSAHVVVKPSEVGVGKFQTFTVGVPVEKESATIGLRLVLPAGLNHVSPNLKPGWNIEIKKSGEGEKTKVNEIVWRGGVIPTGFRDEFIFSAQVPAKTTTINWKAYQTYTDGSVVAWDQDLKTNEANEDFSQSGPYSQTKIIDDLNQQRLANQEKSKLNNFFLLTIVALIISALNLALQLRKK